MSTDIHDITETVHRMGWLADMRRWDDLLDVFTDQVRVDYTALAGGDPADVDPSDLVAGWADSLGALDATQHLLGSVIVDIDDDGSSATATAQFQATHLATIDGQTDRWTLGGNYAFELQQATSGWRIAAVTMTPTWSTGDDQLLARVQARLQSPEALVRRFLDGLEALDVDKALSVFADDAVQEMPYAPEGFPDQLDGIDALRRQYGGLPDAYRSMRFPISRLVVDGNTVIVEYRGEIELVDGGHYDNDYVGIFETVDGHIVRFVERFNPNLLSAAFGDQVDATFSINQSG